MSQAPLWVTFDCYGTLVDWRGGMTAAIESVAPGLADPILVAYHRHEPVLEAALPVPTYREVLTRGLELAAMDCGHSLAPEELDVLARTLPSWPIFPDTPDALRSVQALGWKVGVLSNVDDDLIAPTLRRLGASADEVVTAQQVASYKPDLGHFREFQRRSGAVEGHWVHVACSWHHDVEPCAELGVPCVFINREGEVRDTSAAAAVLPDLTALVQTLQKQFDVETKV